MPWTALPGLIVALAPLGMSMFDVISKIVEKWNSTTPVSIQDIEELRKAGQRTARQALMDALTRAGISLESPQAQALLAMTP